MDWRCKRLTQEVQIHDKDLFAQRVNGIVQIWRNAPKWDAADIEYGTSSARPTQFILALTDNWQPGGVPCDWGIEPVMQRIRDMDLHLKVSFLDDLRKQRERAKEIRKQSDRNEIRARAADMRKEFAQATNEINTSTLEKIDNRRTKWL